MTVTNDHELYEAEQLLRDLERIEDADSTTHDLIFMVREAIWEYQHIAPSYKRQYLHIIGR